MKLAYVDLCGFRGYRKPLRIDFGSRFTIIDGRNGSGKSTIFDAIEYALTGKLGKYRDAAAGESVADYVWWTGHGRADDYYVEVGFRDNEQLFSVRRTQLDGADPERLSQLVSRLCDAALAPESPLDHLCASAIIRDEHITSLSLDLRETERYVRLRDALGALHSEQLISRGNRLVSIAKQRTVAVQQEVTTANAELAAAARRVDEARANLVSDSVMAEAVQRLRVFANSELAPEELLGVARKRIADASVQLTRLQDLRTRWNVVAEERLRLATLSQAVEAADRERDASSKAVEAFSVQDATPPSSSLAAQSRSLIALVMLGRQLGLRDGHCPLCAQAQGQDEYERGLTAAEAIAKTLDAEAARAAEREQAKVAAQARFVKAKTEYDATMSARATAIKTVEDFDKKRTAEGFGDNVTVDEVSTRLEQLQGAIEVAQRDLGVLETLRLSGDLERARRAETDVKARLSRAQERLSRLRKAEAEAQELYDSARRAAGETLSGRLERVLPLMSELYRRLRPHPIWSDIEYSIRGDVRRFLRLQVGGDLNPQFLFSSGQRRATGLAFLLSINLSLAWSRWNTIMLDDPVQHIDDFRAIHLAEVLAQLVSEGRQIICAVEDRALADLLGRRLPVGKEGQAKRLTLSQAADGALSSVDERVLVPLIQSTLGPSERVA